MTTLSHLPALLASALIGTGIAAAPVVAQQTIAATYNGVPVQLRAEYVPASQFAAGPQAQVPPPTTPPPGYTQSYPLPAYLPAEAYRTGQQWANPQDNVSLAGFPDAEANRATNPVPARTQPVYQPAYEQAAYEQAQYDQAHYVQAGYGAYAPPPATVIHTRTVVPVYYPVPVGYAVRGGWGVPRGGWNRGWNGGWNGGFNRRAYGGWGWNGPAGFGRGGYYGGGYYGGGPYGGRGGGCRSSGGGALAGSVAGAALGYGLANRRDRGTGVVIGGLVGALAGTAIERSNRC